MNAPRRHTSAGRAVEPWRNGAGVTAPVAVGTDPSDGRMLWRVSIATIDASGPFSAFSGIDRHIMLLDDDGLALDVGARRLHLDQHDIAAFAGEEHVAARDVDQASAVLNLMVDRHSGVGALELVPVRGEVSASSRANESVVVVALSEGLSLSGHERLRQHDAVELSADRECTLTGIGRVAIARIVRTA